MRRCLGTLVITVYTTNVDIDVIIYGRGKKEDGWVGR